MISEISVFLWDLHILASIGLLIALFFAIKLYRETDKTWYWVTLVLAVFFFALSDWSTILFPISIPNLEILAFLQESSEILASIFFAISCYGIYKTMIDIRKRVE